MRSKTFFKRKQLHGLCRNKWVKISALIFFCLCLLVADWFVVPRAKPEPSKQHYKREQSIWLECHSDAVVCVRWGIFWIFNLRAGRKERWMNWPPMKHKRCAYIISLYSWGTMLGVQSEMDDVAVRNKNNIIHKGYSFACEIGRYAGNWSDQTKRNT